MNTPTKNAPTELSGQKSHRPSSSIPQKSEDEWEPDPTTDTPSFRPEDLSENDRYFFRGVPADQIMGC